MKLYYSRNPQIINKGNAGSRGWFNYESDLNTLLEFIMQGHAWSQGVMKDDTSGKKPKASDIKFAELIAIDVDNSTTKKEKIIGDRYLSYNDAKKLPFVKSNALFIHTSARHTDSWNKFRIIFKLTQKIYDSGDFTHTVKHLQEYFTRNYNCDVSTTNIDRFWYGAENCSYEVFNNEFDNTKIQYIKNDYKHTKKIDPESVSVNLEARELRDYLVSNPGVDAYGLTYNHWLSCCKDILDQFGLSTAEAIIDEWGGDRKLGTLEKLKTMKYGEGDSAFNKRLNKGLFNLQRILAGYGYPLRDAFGDFRSDRTTGEVIKYNQSHQEVLESWLKSNYDFKFNIVENRLYFKNTESSTFNKLKQKDLNQIIRKLKYVHKDISLPISFVNDKQVRDTLKSDFSVEYDPFAEYFENLEAWDGQDRFEDMLEILLCITNENHLYDVYLKYLKGWFVGCVAQALNKGENQQILVLKGPQGVGKTTFGKNLVPKELSEYSREASIDPNRPDDMRKLFSSFLIQIDELDRMSRVRMDELKQITTTSYVDYRVPYDSMSDTYIRRCSFMASVNTAAFLNDETGNRRYLVIELTDMDRDAILTFNWPQLWAQSYEMLNKDYKYWFDYNDSLEINKLNEKYNITSYEYEYLDLWFTKLHTKEEYLTTSSNTVIGFNQYLESQNALSLSEIRNEIVKQGGGHPRQAVLKQSLESKGYEVYHTGKGRRYNIKAKIHSGVYDVMMNNN